MTDPNLRRANFRNRFLDDEKDVFQHNAWDHFEWSDELEETAKKKVDENCEVQFSDEKLQEFEENAAGYWDDFYSIHNNRFFKNRNWLAVEFPELFPLINNSSISINEENKDTSTEQQLYVKNTLRLLRLNERYIGENSSFRVFELGCGAGNTVFPLIAANSDPNLFVYCCDFSDKAVHIVKQSEEYDALRCCAFKCDITAESWEVPFPINSLDCITCIFVLSAINPEKMQAAIQKISSYLKPGGMLLFRDYGAYDMAQLRFKKGRCLGSNFYSRGDGTRCYFFKQDHVTNLMNTAGLEEVHTLVDRRLQVNRGKQLKMYRIWIIAKYRKPLSK